MLFFNENHLVVFLFSAITLINSIQLNIMTFSVVIFVWEKKTVWHAQSQNEADGKSKKKKKQPQKQKHSLGDSNEGTWSMSKRASNFSKQFLCFQTCKCFNKKNGFGLDLWVWKKCFLLMRNLNKMNYYVFKFKCNLKAI